MRSPSIHCLLPIVLVLASAVPFERDGAELDQARTLYEEKDWSGVRDLLQSYVQKDGKNAEAHSLLAGAMARLDDDDLAAHHYELAYDLYLDQDEGRKAKLLLGPLYRVDPIARSKRKLFERITGRVLDAAEKLSESGSTERALDLLKSVEPVAVGKDAEELRKLFEELRAAFEEVDLDAAGADEASAGVWPLYEHSSERYELSCNLEPDVVHLIGETMDHIYEFYVDLYFDGDDDGIKSQRATIRIHPDKQSMLGDWSGGSAPEGWWSPGQRQVVSYDTRSNQGTLDSLLRTLFHEASHQFMTFMSKGGRPPTWLNEGTSSFFEGAVAMADNRVLWPDAAIGRLRSLTFMLEGKTGPTPRQVIEYAQPGSYPGEYYSFGWGFVYFLQQYEDPETLEYVFRPLYAEYRDEATTKPRRSMELFADKFLGKRSPREHETFEDFEKDWKQWILETVKPLHLSPLDKRRALRMQYVDRYVAAADEAAETKKPVVSEAELLLRALTHLEYIRTKIDKDENADAALILLQGSILERLGFKRSAAPLLETWLDLADKGVFEFEQEQYDDIEARLKKLDSKNYELRAIRRKMRELARNARKLLVKYEKSKEPMPLRSYTFSSHIAAIFADDLELAADADRLKVIAREAGVLRGQVLSLVAPRKSWSSVYTSAPRKFTSSSNVIRIADLRPGAMINTEVALEGEYELRGTLERKGKLHRGTSHGIVVAGHPETDWLVVGVTHEGNLGVWDIRVEGDGTTTDMRDSIPIEPSLGDVTEIDFRIHVYGQDKVEVQFGECSPIVVQQTDRLPAVRHAGVFVKDGELRWLDCVVEIYP